MKKQLHLELTTRCNLQCPACPRTLFSEMLNKPVPKQDLDMDEFEKFMDCKSGENIEELLLCGDYGDPIYYPKLKEFIDRFRHKSFSIATAGSHRPKKFWEDLNTVLTENDEVVFGIDGLEDTNHLYRRNSNWQSILEAVDTVVKGPARVRWQTIIFSFNHNKLSEIKQFAEDRGAEFFALKTHRYGDESLRPPNDDMVEIHHMWDQNFVNNEVIEIEPLCDVAKIVTADGHFLPCDWIRNPKTFYKSDLWREKDKWYNRLAISDINLDQGLERVEEWKQLVINKGLSGSPKLDHLCKMRCRKGCYQDQTYDVQ